MDKKYWENYYANQAPSEQPSDFARFIAGRHVEAPGVIFDIGCGNGRDTLYFSSLGLAGVGVEQCEVAIAKNTAKGKSMGLPAKFHQADFSACDYDALAARSSYTIYSRFTLHAINYEEEARLFACIGKMQHLRYLCIEARSLRDDLYGQGTEVGPHEFVTSHYRRFIDPEALKQKLAPAFEIEHFEEGRGFAKTANDDPCLIRLVARRITS